MFDIAKPNEEERIIDLEFKCFGCRSFRDMGNADEKRN